MREGTTKTVTIVAIFELLLAAGILAFWTAFFTTDLVDIDDQHLKEIYLVFERAFPIPDTYLTVILIIGGIGLLKDKTFGYLFSLMGGASLIFLGLLDVSFNVQNGMYLIGVGEAVLNIAINLLCLGFGIFLIVFLWKKRIHFRQ